MSGRPEFILATVAILLVFIVLLQWSFIKRKLYDLRLRRAIKKLGKKVLCNVTVPDGADGVVHIERLVLTPTAILLVSIKRFNGVIFAGDKIDFWTQVVDRRSFKFNNPLIQMDEDIMSVKALIPDSEVKGYMIFTGESEFPKGKPDRVMLLSELKDIACNKRDQVSEKLQEDWLHLMQSVVR
jgi:hypothetical protein